jgi:hypothetical protein
MRRANGLSNPARQTSRPQKTSQVSAIDFELNSIAFADSAKRILSVSGAGGPSAVHVALTS